MRRFKIWGRLELLEVDNILIIDKPAYHLNNKTEISKLTFQVSNQLPEALASVEEKLALIIKDNIKLRMRKWRARLYMVVNLIND